MSGDVEGEPSVVAGAPAGLVRIERNADRARIEVVLADAFGTREVGAFVDGLRAAGALVPGLVAEVDGRVVGAALLARGSLRAEPARPVGWLVVVAVERTLQRLGIGTALIERVLALEPDAPILAAGPRRLLERFGFVPLARVGLELPDPPIAGPWLAHVPRSPSPAGVVELPRPRAEATPVEGGAGAA
ncbi:MAG: hypothetical protein KatS3mg013_0294 [Actinomycetota bacterium]|nr:MAG: hypothetical protein KatS3mg013_0294 [Actinomycetota bacterium]